MKLFRSNKADIISRAVTLSREIRLLRRDVLGVCSDYMDGIRDAGNVGFDDPLPFGIVHREICFGFVEWRLADNIHKIVKLSRMQDALERMKRKHSYIWLEVCEYIYDSELEDHVNTVIAGHINGDIDESDMITAIDAANSKSKHKTFEYGKC